MATRFVVAVAVTHFIICIARRTRMAEEQKQCAHEPCLCTVPHGEKFCSEFCKDAGSGEVEIACECGHPACE